MKTFNVCQCKNVNLRTLQQFKFLKFQLKNILNLKETVVNVKKYFSTEIETCLSLNNKKIGIVFCVLYVNCL